MEGRTDGRKDGRKEGRTGGHGQNNLQNNLYYITFCPQCIHKCEKISRELPTLI